MLGNAMEWCQDQPMVFDTDTERMDDKEQMGKLSNSGFRVLRGGSSSSVATTMRSADRYANQPVNRYSLVGFRASRTLLPVAITALPPAESNTGR